MISRQVILRYPFFADLNPDQVRALAEAASELAVEKNGYFFREEDFLDHFYLVVEGTAAILMGVTDRAYSNSLSQQITGNVEKKNVIVGTASTGEVFGWSALIPPHNSTASVQALTDCQVAAFDCNLLRPVFETDLAFACLMSTKAAQIVRERMRMLRMETLYDYVENPEQSIITLPLPA